MVAIASILKIFNCYLVPNGKPDWAKTWWKASGKNEDLEWLKWFHLGSQDANMAAILKILKSHQLPDGKSDWA